MVEEATSEIVRFDSEVGNSLETYGPILLRSESAASSKIEHLTASARAIATAEVEHTGGRNALAIVSNTATMQAAIALADHLVPDTILRLHAALMGDQPAIAGQWRTQQVWIGAGEGGPRIADFVPPDYTRVPSLIEDVSTFMRRTDMPVLVQTAIAHAQFETIHPFADGNGRRNWG